MDTAALNTRHAELVETNLRLKQTIEYGGNGEFGDRIDEMARLNAHLVVENRYIEIKNMNVHRLNTQLSLENEAIRTRAPDQWADELDQLKLEIFRLKSKMYRISAQLDLKEEAPHLA